jgi:hypothetical protein
MVFWKKPSRTRQIATRQTLTLTLSHRMGEGTATYDLLRVVSWLNRRMHTALRPIRTVNIRIHAFVRFHQ